MPEESSFSRRSDGVDEIDRRQSSDPSNRQLAERRRESRLAAMGLIAGRIAHDLNNRLTVLIGNVQLLLKRLESGDCSRQETEALLAAIETSGRRAAVLAGHLRETAKPPPCPAEAAARIESIFDLVLSELRPHLPERVDLCARCEAELEPLAGDERQLADLLLHLMDNAAQAVGGGPGTISLRASPHSVTRDDLPTGFHGADLGPGDYVELEVADSGDGIDPPLRTEMFKPFVSGRGREGLGLVVAVEIARCHGGAIALDSAPGEGARFRVLLPARERTTAPGEGGPPDARRADAPRPEEGEYRPEAAEGRLPAELRGAALQVRLPSSAGRDPS